MYNRPTKTYKGFRLIKYYASVWNGNMYIEKARRWKIKHITEVGGFVKFSDAMNFIDNL